MLNNVFVTLPRSPIGKESALRICSHILTKGYGVQPASDEGRLLDESNNATLLAVLVDNLKSDVEADVEGDLSQPPLVEDDEIPEFSHYVPYDDEIPEGESNPEVDEELYNLVLKFLKDEKIEYYSIIITGNDTGILWDPGDNWKSPTVLERIKEEESP